MTRELRVALLQLRAIDLERHEAGWAHLLDRLDAALADGPDLVVLPEASYPAYFLGSRDAYDRAGVLPDTDVQSALAERARRSGSFIAAGLVQRAGEGAEGQVALENVALLFDRSGSVVARQPKRFLWHFDRTWFQPGQRSEVVTLAEGRAGIVICADTRLPEITRELALKGTELLIDCTAWVSSGREAAALNSPQVEYMMPARAMESGAWILAADKVGTEARSIVYAGRSGVIDPRGRWIVQAPADEPGVVTATIDLDEAGGPPLPPRPELVGPRDGIEASQRAHEPISVADATARVAVASIDPSPSAVALMEDVRRFARTLAAQQVDLVVLPDLTGDDPRAVNHNEVLPQLTRLSAESGVALVTQLAERTPGGVYKTVFALESGEVLARYRQSHLHAAERAAGFAAGGEPPPVIATVAGAVGLLGGSEGLAPELAQDLKLRGAELIAWTAGSCLDARGVPLPLRALARSRAAEQRLYVAAAGPAGRRFSDEEADLGGALLVDPNGLVLTETLRGATLAMSADINRALTRWHRMAPGTDPIAEPRQPHEPPEPPEPRSEAINRP